MKLKYVGVKKDGEAAFQGETGIFWLRGSVHEVANEQLAQRMLAHPDVFQPADEGDTQPPAADSQALGLESGEKKPEGSGEQQPPASPSLPPFTAEDLADLEDAQLKALAQARGLDVDGRKKGDKLRAALLEAQAARG